MPVQVVNGAQLMCSMGMAPSALVVLPVNRTMSGTQPGANIMDHVPMLNIMPFGMCRSPANPTVASATAAAFGVLTPMPCIPATPAPWVPGEMTVMLGNQPSLENTCTLSCLWAGTIQVAMPGQVTHMIAGQAGGGGGGGAGAGAVAAGAGSTDLGRASGIVTSGTAAEQKSLAALVEKIRNSGPKGKAFIEALEKSPKKTHLFVGTSAEKKDGTVVQLSATGGGVTLRPSESKSGDNEVYVDPTHLIQYTATDGSSVTEKPEGLLLHEMGHAKLLNDGDAAQTSGGPAAEQNVRTLTNPIRTELGMKPEK